MSEMAIGMVGLGVRGRNLALNIEEKGFGVSAWDAWPEPVDKFVAASKGKKIAGFHELAGVVKSLRRPRRIILTLWLSSAQSGTNTVPLATSGYDGTSSALATSWI